MCWLGKNQRMFPFSTGDRMQAHAFLPNAF